MSAPGGIGLDGDAEGAAHVEPTAKRIRAVFQGEVVVDTTAALLVWEHRYYPQYYIPAADISPGLLAAAKAGSGSGLESESESGRLGLAEYFTLTGAKGSVVDGAWRYPEANPAAIQPLVRFDWAAMDAWFEEDEEVVVHPRSPYVRVDVLDSGRTVRVEIEGTVVAESNRPKLLFETGLTTRYYLPKTDVRLDLLRPTDSATSCPYKGTARYWSVEIDGVTHDDVVWGYDAPLAESIKTAGLMCFYNERVDLFLDGVAQC